MKNKKLDLQKFFERKILLEEIIEDGLNENLAALLALAPPELKKYISEGLFNIDWFKALYSNSVKGNFNSDKIKEPKDYGFKNKKDEIMKLNLLKKAWRGIVEVKIDTRFWYVEVYFKMILK